MHSRQHGDEISDIKTDDSYWEGGFGRDCMHGKLRGGAWFSELGGPDRVVVDFPPLPPIPTPSSTQKGRICANLMCRPEARGSGPLDPLPSAAPR